MKFISAPILAALALAVLPVAAPALTPLEEAVEAVKAGQFVRAEDILTPMVAKGRADPVALYNMSLVRFAQKQNEEAIKLVERAIKGDSTKVEYFLQLGVACSARLPEVGPMDGNAIATKMKKAYEKVLSLDPKNMTALTGLTRFYEHAPEIVGGSMKRAIEYAERIRQVDAYQGEVELGRLAAGINDFPTALTHYEAASKLRPADLATATACGWTLYKMGRKEEARTRFLAVLQIDANFEPAKLGLTETAPPAH